ncbi:MAG: hypothetical protein RQ751_09665 [Longimicrobiales bacterium]|nr:hypothetical protein [Longimicrobiales bacterium]
MRPRRGVALFLLGMAVAVVVEAGMGLLLFVSPGFLPALTAVLALALGSLGAGLALGPSPVGTGGAGDGRWRWFLAVGSLLVAAAVSLGWSFQGPIPDGALGRGVHLALLVALPLYGLGACLADVMPRRSGARGAALALAGGAVGVVLLAVALLPRFEPVSVYSFCILCLASAALVREPA